MNRLLSILIFLTWSLWFGGMAVLILFVARLFGSDRETATHAAPILFRTFANYQIVVGMIACAAAAILSLRMRRKSHAVFTLLMIVSLAAALLIYRGTYRMEEIRAAGQSQGEEFKQLHKQSTAIYTTSAAILLMAGIGWAVTLPGAGASRRKAEETAPA